MAVQSTVFSFNEDRVMILVWPIYSYYSYENAHKWTGIDMHQATQSHYSYFHTQAHALTRTHRNFISFPSIREAALRKKNQKTGTIVYTTEVTVISEIFLAKRGPRVYLLFKFPCCKENKHHQHHDFQSCVEADGLKKRMSQLSFERLTSRCSPAVFFLLN